MSELSKMGSGKKYFISQKFSLGVRLGFTTIKILNHGQPLFSREYLWKDSDNEKSAIKKIMKIEPEEKAKTRAKRTVTRPQWGLLISPRTKYIPTKPVKEVIRKCVTVKDKLLNARLKIVLNYLKKSQHYSNISENHMVRTRWPVLEYQKVPIGLSDVPYVSMDSPIRALLISILNTRRVFANHTTHVTR